MINVVERITWSFVEQRKTLCKIELQNAIQQFQFKDSFISDRLYIDIVNLVRMLEHLLVFIQQALNDAKADFVGKSILDQGFRICTSHLIGLLQSRNDTLNVLSHFYYSVCEAWIQLSLID